MQVSVEAIGNLERHLKVSLPIERIDDEFNQRVSELKQQMRIPGFRPGKVPANVITSRYGSSVRAEVVEKLIRISLQEAFISQNIQPAGVPHLKDIQAEAGKPLEYIAVFEVYPDIKLADLSACTVEKPATSVTETDIDNMLTKLQKQHVSWTRVEREAKSGDRVVIDFAGTMDGIAFQGGSAQDVPVIIGSKSMIDGFEQGLIDAKAATEIDLDLQFPEDYHHADFAGKPVHFKVTVKEVQAEQLPELDDKFAERFDIKEGGLTALRQEIQQNMQRELDFAQKAFVKNQVLEKLLEVNEVEVPKSLIQEEAKRLQNELSQELQRRTGTKKLPELPLENFTEQAEKRVKLGLLLAEAIKQLELKADSNLVREKIEQLATVYEQPEHMVNWYYSDPERLSAIEAAVIEDQVVDKLLEQCKIQDKPMNYEDVVNPSSVK